MLSPEHAIREGYIYPWMTSIQKLFAVLEDETTVLVTDECAMQVSVSANGHYGWDSLDQVKSLAKSILYFERVIRTILPYDRR